MNATQQAILKQANLAMVDAYLQQGTLGDEQADFLMHTLLAKNALKVQKMAKVAYPIWAGILGLVGGAICGLEGTTVGGVIGLMIAACMNNPQTKLLQLRSMTADSLGEVCSRARAMGL